MTGHARNLKQWAAVASIAVGAWLWPPLSAADTVLVGKIVYEDRRPAERDKGPVVVVLDLATQAQKVVAAPALHPRWLPSGQEIAYFLPDNIANGGVDIPDAPEKRLGPSWISRYAAILPGRTIIVGIDGSRRRELKHFVADIDAAGRLALTMRPSATEGRSIRNRSGDVLIQDVATGELSTLLTSAQIGGGNGESIRDARWMPDGRSIIYQTQIVRRNEAGNLVSSWSLYLADIKTGKQSKLPIAAGLPSESTGPYNFAPSPDGRTIAFSIVEDRGLWTFDPAAGKSTRIEVGERRFRKGRPAFSPDGQFILFELTDQTDAYGTTSFWTAPSGGGSARRLLPRSWRHIVRFLVLQESHHSADWWQPR